MEDSKILQMVCTALTTITRDLTANGYININDNNILQVTFDQLQFDSLDRVELSMELEGMLELPDTEIEVFEKWNTISDVVSYIKNLN